MAPVVDVCFRLTGRAIPADHGYSLYSAICRVIPEVHANGGMGIHPIAGSPAGGRMLVLSVRSRLAIRLSADRIADVLPLAGRALRIGDSEIRVGIPTIRALEPAARLYSRLVSVKGFMEPEPFLKALKRQLDAMAVRGEAGLLNRKEATSVEGRVRRGAVSSPFVRRTVRIRDKEVVGYAVLVRQLTADESLHLQERGLGGRRRFGCGVFVPFGRTPGRGTADDV